MDIHNCTKVYSRIAVQYIFEIQTHTTNLDPKTTLLEVRAEWWVAGTKTMRQPTKGS